MPRRTQDPARIRWNFVYRVCTFFDWPFNAIRLSLLFPRCSPTTPVLRLVWALPISLAATFGIEFSFFSSGYLDVSVHRVPSCRLCIHLQVLEVYSSGFPHSEIDGSLRICQSPSLIAAYHVFRRLLVPRHPPYALNA